MISSLWFWNSQLAPTVTDYFPLAAWRKFAGTERYTVGGICMRLIQFSSSPLLLFASRDQVLAVVSTASMRAAFHDMLLSESSLPPAVFVPGEKVLGQYPVTCPGYTHESTLTGPDGVLPPGDIRARILAGLPPNYTASSIINSMGDHVPIYDDNWLVYLDQLSGEVVYWNDPVKKLSAFVAAFAMDNNVEIPVALERSGY